MHDSKYITISFTLGSSDMDLASYLEQCENKSFVIKKALREYMMHHPIATEIKKPESIPTEDGLIRAIIKILYVAKHKNIESLSLSELYECVAKTQNLSDEQINSVSPKTGINIYKNRIRFSLNLAKKKGYINNPSRGIYVLTDYGVAIGQFLYSIERLENEQT